METEIKKPGRPAKTEVILERVYVPFDGSPALPKGSSLKVDKAELEWIVSKGIGRAV